MSITRETYRKRKQYDMLYNSYSTSSITGKMLVFSSNGKGRVWVEVSMNQGMLLLRCSQCEELSDGTRFMFGYGTIDGGRISDRCRPCRSRISLAKLALSKVENVTRTRTKSVKKRVKDALQTQLTILHKLYANDRALYRKYGKRIDDAYKAGELPSDRLRMAFEDRRLKILEEAEVEKRVRRFAESRMYPEVSDLVAEVKRM